MTEWFLPVETELLQWTAGIASSPSITVDGDLVSGKLEGNLIVTFDTPGKDGAMQQGYAQLLSPGRRVAGIARVRNRDLGIDWSIPLAPMLERRLLYPVDRLNLRTIRIRGSWF